MPWSLHNAAVAYDGGPADSFCLEADFISHVSLRNGNDSWSVGPLL